MKSRLPSRIAIFAAMAFFLTPGAALLSAQAATHFLGTVARIDGNTLTIKSAQGAERQVEVPASADLKRVEPGQTSLSAAVPMQLNELAPGDRVLVWIDPNSPAGSPQALRLVAIKAGDLAKKHAEEAEAWKTNGVGGLVKSVDAAAGTIVIRSGAGPATRPVTIHVDKGTVLKRYAPASVSYAQARSAPIGAIHIGDQLMARGVKSDDGAQLTAKEVVSGTFRNVSGIIASIDSTNSTFTLKDLATKKMVTVRIDDAAMRRVPEHVAQLLAARLKGAAPPNAGGNSGENGEGARWRSGAALRGQGGMDEQQMLDHLPAIHFSDLKKGDAVMLVATPGASEVTAITLLSGVEPLLEAPASEDLLANWSMGSGASDASAAAGQP